CRVNHAASARIITANGATKTSIGKIDNFLIKVNSIIVSIKVLVMETTQYQALIGATAQPKWQHTRVPAIFSWTNTDHNELSPILSWNNKGKGKKENKPQEDTTNKITSGWESFYSTNTRPKPPYISLQYKNCKKKLFSMGAWVVSDKDYWIQTHYYCKPYYRKCYSYPKCQDKWDNKLCLTCEGICDTSCQYTIFINDWISRETPITARMANTKIEGALPSKILEIKNNFSEPVEVVLILNTFLDIETGPEEFHEHYQNLAPT
ncbi:hypothetical protein G9A89_023973, partial [Geosiphon pyriformis]